MRYTFFLFVLGAIGLGVSQVPAGRTSTGTKFFEVADSLRSTIDSTVILNKTKAKAVDSVQQLTEYMRLILSSHDYRVYRYANPRLKLVYKWQKGTPGHWELIRKIYY